MGDEPPGVIAVNLSAQQINFTNSVPVALPVPVAADLQDSDTVPRAFEPAAPHIEHQEGGTMEGFPNKDLDECCGSSWPAKSGICCCLTFTILICVLIPTSLGTIGSADVALAYDNFNSILGEQLYTEGLQTRPTFGSFIKWPITNQRIDLALTCNSRDAIKIDLTVDFLYIPIAQQIRKLTLDFINFQGYMDVVTMVSRASVRNACGYFTAREFQTKRSEVAKKMEEILMTDLQETMATKMLVLNLRNIDRPVGYQTAVDASEAALADIELARKEEQQQLIKAETVLQGARVDSNKTIDDAAAQADILVATAEQEVKLAAQADVDLAKAERVQLLTQAETSLKMAEINSNKTVAKANADAAAIEAESQSRYDAIKDKYSKFGNLLKTAKDQLGAAITNAGVMTYLANTLVGVGKQQVALDAPAQFSYSSTLAA